MRSISRSYLANMYGIARKTLYNWFKLADIKVRKGCAICWQEQQTIFEMFGDPVEYKQQQKEKKDKKEKDKYRNNR